jgi:hypothetical protein
MTLYDAIQFGGELVAVCCSPKCGTRTPLEARFFAARQPLDTPLERIAKRIPCAKCGGPIILSVRNAAAVGDRTTRFASRSPRASPDPH